MVESENPCRLLYCSSKCDKVGVIQPIQELKKGVEPSLADYDRRTALHLAACEDCTEVFLLRLEKGADVNSLDRWGRTPSSDARSFGHEEICKILEARGGTDPVELDSQTPCYEIDFKGVDMETAALIGEELGLWQRLHHPNIVQFIGVLKHCDRLTEYLRNGSLYDILKRMGRLDPPTAVAYALDIVRNVLPDESGRLKVTDFGLSKIAQEKDSRGYKMTGGTGSYHYMAPEVYC
ncbi:hypothetical protein SLEP1_g10048 [Rubroshorea leprosula]|uniref:Protein kinase domain-containing protein n=1 Tax=Rubroshorea leprosula TaxID=152421 RepID=A0AAV5IHU9_9ROSI|nr:hypothetical protein SLEP1_g10048 [Rubroshorea leprosula]